MTERKYKNPLTLDGRVRLVPGVSQAKIEKVKELVEAHKAGDRIASAMLQEALTTSDAIFNLAHLATLNFLPEYDQAPRNWQTIAGTRTAPDFRPVSLYSLSQSWTDGSGEPGVLDRHSDKLLHGAAPIVPEGTPYPYAYFTSEISEQNAKIVKRGFKTDWTLEARINDGINSLDNLPSEMLQVALDTDEADVWGALVNGVGASSTLAGGTIPDGSTTVAVNAPFSREALIRALIELPTREINGRKIQVRGTYNLVVPVGQGIYVNFVLNQTLNQIETGDATGPRYLFQVNGGYNPLAGIKVVESEWVTGTEWYLLPTPGSTRRPVLEHLNLRGYESPQLFVENAAGTYVGGGVVSPFEGSFDADVITLKLRQFSGGVLWDSGLAVVYSDGTGS